MKIPTPLLAVAKGLGPLRDRVVFVGGMIRGLLVTDPAAGPLRPTDDVDMIIDVPTLGDYYTLEAQLRDLGFHEDMEEGAPICRWVIDGVRADVMPIDPGILGFSNVWYEGAVKHAAVTKTPEGLLRHLDGPHFCATKLEAFAGRGSGDLFHHDLEDFIALVDERQSLGDEIANAAEDIRKFIAQTVRGFLALEAFKEALPGHLQGDSASQGRLPMLLSRLQRIAALDSKEITIAPRLVGRSPPLLPSYATRNGIGPGAPTLASPLPVGQVTLHSTNLRSADYDQTTKRLTIEFHGGRVYQYSGVPLTVFEGLLRAHSAGRYFNLWIRNSYQHRRL